MYQFGSGTAFVTPFGPAAAANPSPIQLQTLQESNIDISNSQKELMGKNQFAVAIARTTGKMECKFKFANLNIKGMNDLFFGGAVQTGQEIGVPDFSSAITSHAAIISTTNGMPSGATFGRNLGVRNGLTGKQMTLVIASAEVAGISYSFSAGTYTFASGETATTASISFTYTVSTGFSSTVQNLPMGTQPQLDVTLMNAQYVSADGSLNCLLRFPLMVSAKFSLPYKNEDFVITEFDCSAQADAQGRVLMINVDE